MASASLGNNASFSWAIMSLFAWLMPHISVEIGEYHRALHKSPLWLAEASKQAFRRSEMLQRTFGKSNIRASNEVSIAVGKSAIRWAAISANIFSILLIVAAACGVALNTKNLESRMVKITIGLSRLVGATILFALSWKFPEWLEVYHIRPRRDVLPVSCSVRALKLNVFLSVVMQYFLVFFFLLPFYCGAGPIMIPVSAVVGLVIGCIVDLCVYWGRKHLSDGYRKEALYIIFAMISITVLNSAALFASGCEYIHDVWGDRIWGESETVLGVVLGTFFAWLILGALIHFFLWKLTKVALNEKMKRPSWKIRASLKSTRYKNPIGTRVAAAVTKATSSATGNSATEAAGNSRSEKDEGNNLCDDTEINRREKSVVFDDTTQDENLCSADDKLQEEAEKQAREDKERHDIDKHYDSDSVSEPTYFSLVKAKICGIGGQRCCCCRCCDGKETWHAKAISGVKWTLWVILSCFSLWLITINIGATYQQDVVRNKLPLVRKILYEPMNDIEVCAYDGDGTEGSLNENSNIVTFQNKNAAHYAGFLILHCGKCAACSTWPNIKYEYTTRKNLAKWSAKCARMSLTGGEDAVHSCLMAPPISWDDACGRCWTTDITCTKKHCAFIFLQSTMIDAMADFAVGMDQVTSATCEEANCEAYDYPADFVECSGATRRRMNITSGIVRDPSEQCAIVDVSWERLFPGQ